MDRRSLLFLFSLILSFLIIKSWYEPPPQTKKIEQIEEAPIIEETVISQPEKQLNPTYFVLENEYQQLVFTSVGGAIAEINLPFKSKSNQNSVVLPVEADRKIAEDYPNQDLFPLVSAKTFDESIIDQKEGGYYPLLRRGDPIPGCGTITSSYPELASLPFTLVSHTPTSITLESKQAHRYIKKTFSFPENPHNFPYCIDVEITIDGNRKDLWLSSGVPEVEWLAGTSGAALKYRIVRGNSASVDRVDLPKTTFTNTSTRPDWTCNSNGFFGIILDPLQGQGSGFAFQRIPGDIARSRLLLFNEARIRYSPLDLPGFESKIPFSPTHQTMKLRLFAGPFADSVLTQIDHHSEEIYGKPTNYLACQTFHGWFAFISEPFAKFLFFIMKQIYKLFGSWTLSIILTTVVLRILLYPLNRWSFRSMRAMQEIAPLMKAIQEKHKKDPVRAQMEIMALYKEKKVNPFSGCLPLLIQMPFLIGMFDLLKSTFELRGASFIPGWINDLSAPDILFEWSFHIPFIGDEFHLLPFILGGTMWLQQHLSSTLPKDPNEWTDQQRQQKAMGTLMTVVMTIMFYHFPSGLNIYWISSMLLGILQQWWTNRNNAKT